MTISFTLPDLIDNGSDEKTMTTALNALLVEGSSIRIATGFFNLNGYTLVRAGLANTRSAQVLLGKEPSTPERRQRSNNLEMVDDEIAGDLSEALSSGQRERAEQIHHFLDWLQRDSVGFKLYQRNFFHAKAYIFDGVPHFGQVAIVGSSNFTAAGLTGNTELNMAQKQAAVAREFSQWFDRFWNDPDSLDYKPRLIELYTQATALHSPYLIYMKSLWEALSDRIGGDLLPADQDRPSPIILTNFQQDGYAAAKQILETYNGVVIADPVGFGKTYLALRLLDDYAYQLRQKALIICPAQLRNVWWEPKLEAFNIRADIQSQERISQSDFDTTKYGDYDLVIVDECHNFRNPVANRWQNLSRLMTTGRPKKIVLLTATPINTSVFDFYHQLRLITKDRADYFAGVGIGDLFNYFRRAEGNREGLHDLLETIAVRRSRDFIRKYYPSAAIDGRIVHFPERVLHTANYNLEKTYEGLYADVVQVIEDLHLAPYLIDFYRAGVPKQLRLFLAGEQSGNFERISPERAMVLGRQMALAGIMKVLYLKRLESSVQSLKISLDRARRFQERFLEQLKYGRLLRSRDFQKTETLLRSLDDNDDAGEEDRALAEAEINEDIDQLLAGLEPIDSADYDVDAIEVAIKHDVQELERVSKRLEPLTQAEDDKLAELKRQLTGELHGHKVLVFSYFKDTARYLWRTLSRDATFLAGLGHAQISFAYSGLDPQERRNRIERFAPRSNGRPELAGTADEIQLLISTDVLSEGQNLQDADVLINYDLHWNPVRMVQRAGRVDRLGSEFERIHLYNFIPEDALESLLAIVQRLRDRLDAINRAGLLDAPVMGEVPTPLDFNALRKIAAEDGSILDELESVSDLDTGEFLKQELLEFLKKVGEERLRELPPGVGTGKRARNGRRGLYVHLRAGAQHFQLFYDLSTGQFENRRLESIKLARCKEDDEPIAPDFDIFPIIARSKKHVVDYMRQARLKLPRLIPPQNHVMNWLKSQDTERYPAVKRLREYFGIPLPNPQLRKLKRIWNQRQGTDARSFVEVLQTFVRDNPVTKTERPEIAELSEDDLQVICHMALV